MSAPGEAQLDALTADFAAAAQLLRDGLAELAMARLLPLHLAEHELALRVHLMIGAGVLATARLAGSAAVLDLIDSGYAEAVDLVDLVGLYAATLIRRGG